MVFMDFLLHHSNYFATGALVMIGLYGMLVKGNLVKKLMGMNISQVGVILFFISLGMKSKSTVPISQHLGDHGVIHAHDYLNPLPHGLMLTAIVVGVSTTGVALALLIKIFRSYGTLEEGELIKKLNERA